MKYVSVTLFMAVSANCQSLSAPLPARSCQKVTRVKTIQDIENNHLEGGQNALFWVEEEETFLSPWRKDQWRVKSKVEDFVQRLVLLRSRLKGKSHAKWVEFKFTDVREEENAEMEPVSFCHDETYGHGGSVMMQGVVSETKSLEGTIGVLFDIYTVALLLTAKTSLETGVSKLIALACPVEHGEIVQLFLRHTRYLHYTPQYRLRAIENGKFTKGGDFEVRPQEERIVAGGIGEWMCVSSRLAPLQCGPAVRKIVQNN